jgi:hypothetical protein
MSYTLLDEVLRMAEKLTAEERLALLAKARELAWDGANAPKYEEPGAAAATNPTQVDGLCLRKI